MQPGTCGLQNTPNSHKLNHPNEQLNCFSLQMARDQRCNLHKHRYAILFRVELAAVIVNLRPMSRKATADSANGFGDIIGVALLAAALLLLVAQFSSSHKDIAYLSPGLKDPTHN